VHQENLIIELQTFYFAGDGMLSLKRHRKGRSQDCEKQLQLRHVCPSASPPNRIEQLGSNWMGFMGFDIWVVFEKLPRKFKFHENLTRITGTLHEDQY